MTTTQPQDLLDVLISPILTKRQEMIQQAIEKLDKELPKLKAKKTRVRNSSKRGICLEQKLELQRQIKAIDQQISDWYRSYFNRQDELEAEIDRQLAAEDLKAAETKLMILN